MTRGPIAEAAAEPTRTIEAHPDAEPNPEPEAERAATGSAATTPELVLGPAPSSIDASDSFAVAGRKAMWLHVDRMLSREAAIRDPGEVDALRKYRVATRRLRAAIRVFRDAYPARDLKAIRADLSDLADAIGAVRDLDVRIADLDRWANERAVAEADAGAGTGTGAKDEVAASVEVLREAWAGQRARAAASLVHRLNTKRHRRLLASLASFVTVTVPGGRTAASGPARTVRDRTASSVWEAYEQVRAYTSIVRWADLDTLHAIRIEAKRLRYTIEFLGSVIGPHREPLVARLVALQDHLGALNDAAVTASAIRAFLEERHAALMPAERAAIASYLGDRERDLSRLRRGVGRAWRPVVSVTFARRLGRAVVVRPAG